MNTNILKVTLLCMVSLVNSYPTPEPDIPYQFKDIKLRSYLFKDGIFPEFSPDYLNTQIQVSLASWKPGVSLPKGTWDLYLVVKNHYYHNNNLTLKIAEIEYNGTEHSWVRIQDLEWINIPSKNLYEFKIMLKPSNISTSDIKEFKNSSAQNWTYNMFFKTKDASLEGIREDENNMENPTVEFCSGDIATVGPNKTLGARCSFDPLTLKSMHQCLNWRRADSVGSKCRDIMNTTTEEKSMDVFCAKDRWLTDCKCNNRRYYKEYQERKLIEKLPDYCWYSPCKQNTYLTKRKGERVQCIYEHCENTHVYGTRYILSCKRTESGLPEYPSEPMANPDY